MVAGEGVRGREAQAMRGGDKDRAAEKWGDKSERRRRGGPVDGGCAREGVWAEVEI